MANLEQPPTLRLLKSPGDVFAAMPPNMAKRTASFHFEQLAALSTEGFVAVDNDGLATFVNLAAMNLLDLDADAIIGMEFMNVFGNEHEDRLHQFLTGTTRGGQIVIMTNENESRRLLLTTFVDPAGAGQLIIIQARSRHNQDTSRNR